MSKTISQLKSMWNKERESYKIQEVGSGVQRFVKDVLECTDIFNLKEGELSTLKVERKNEFIYEKKTKDRRRADFVIFINSDIIIPIEAEQYTNIEQGEGQLFQYQSDIEKKYGILTDGYTWRFYNNSLYRVFTLDRLLSETDYFLEFWKEYIKPEYYYLSFFEEAGQLSFFGKEALPIDDNRQLFFQDMTTLIESFRKKLTIEGYFNGLGEKEAKKKGAEITYAYIIQFILYKTLVDNGFDDFGNDYKGRIEIIHNALKIHSYKDILGVIDGMSHQISENIYRPFVEEQEHIGGKFPELYRKVKNELSDVSPWLDIVVFIKKYNFQNIHNEIFGYVYENYLKELYEDEKKGQYFTDPSVVNFMLEQVGYTAKEIRNRIKAGESDKLSIVDPACGSGTFLYRATDEVIKSFSTITGETSKQIEAIVTSNIFGLDVGEFPLYLAEMGILMRMLPLIMGEKYNNPLEKKIKVFWTQDSIAEFIGSGLVTLGKQISFPDRIIKPKFDSFVRTEEDLTEMKGSMTSFPRRRFDYVVANPPYVSYNECSKQGVLVFDLLKRGKVKLNNIYGVNLHSVPGSPKRYPPKPNLYAFFIALGLALLKEDGRLCYIVPQTFLVNADFDVLRFHLSKFATMEKIVTFSGKMFLGRGLKQNRPIPTSSMVLIASRKLPTPNQEVEIVNYQGSDDTIEDIFANISQNINTTSRRMLQSQLLQNLKNWNVIKLSTDQLEFLALYTQNSEDFSAYYEHSLAKGTFGSTFVFDEGYDIDERQFLLSSVPGQLCYQCPRLNSKYWTLQEFNGHWPNARTKGSPMYIALLKANQGYSFLDAQYKIIWSYNATDRFFYTEKPVIWARNKMLGIASNDRREILYLFAILNSKITKFILNTFVKIAQEDTRTILVSLQIVKKQLRTPKITAENQPIKDAIIRHVEHLLEYEHISLSDFVDFSNTLLQRFDDVQVDSNTLVLMHGNQGTKLKITGDAKLVAGIIAKEFGVRGMKLEKRQVGLPELRNLQMIDFERQAQLKDYIDDLVFALYFKIPLTEVGLDKTEEIQKACSKSKYYQLL